MKKILTLLAFVFTLEATAQTAQEHFLQGIEKHNQQDYKGAIKDYTKAIKEDKAHADAYFNRSSCLLALQEFDNARADLDKVIELDPKYTKAYYSRATVLVSKEKYMEALPDLDKVIELDRTLPHALTLRGQIRVQTGNKEGGCEDFRTAGTIGDPQAAGYLSKFCDGEQQAEERLELNWPEKENWKVGADQQDGERRVIDMVRANETVENWTELGNMTILKGITGVPIEKAMEIMYEQLKENAPKAALTLIEKNETAEYPWIIFTIETPRFKDDSKPESQVWYIIQGNTALYTNFWAIKEARIPADQQEKWATFFKTGRIVKDE